MPHVKSGGMPILHDNPLRAALQLSCRRSRNSRLSFSGPRLEQAKYYSPFCVACMRWPRELRNQHASGPAWGPPPNVLPGDSGPLGAGARAHFEYALVPLRTRLSSHDLHAHRNVHRVSSRCVIRSGVRTKTIRVTGQTPPRSLSLSLSACREVRRLRRGCQDEKGADFKIEYTRRAASAFVNRDPLDEQ